MMITRKVSALTGNDTVLGALGCCLAAGSATFGIFMILHGPVVNLGTSGNFTVFAQLAPRPQAPTPPDAKGAAPDLDLTSTASIPKREKDATTNEHATPTNVAVQTASAKDATISVDGRTEVVHIGDNIPGVGQILAIVPGANPLVRTSHGLIAAAR